MIDKVIDRMLDYFPFGVMVSYVVWTYAPVIDRFI